MTNGKSKTAKIKKWW